MRGASTITGPTRGYDAAKKISGRTTFAITDTLGLLVAVAVVAASASDNAGGVIVADACGRLRRCGRLWCDAGFKKAFSQHCDPHGVAVEVVRGPRAPGFVALPKRWVVERTWSWLMNNRRLQIDYERDPAVTEGIVWAAHTRYPLRRLTEAPPPNHNRAATTNASASQIASVLRVAATAGVRRRYQRAYATTTAKPAVKIVSVVSQIGQFAIGVENPANGTPNPSAEIATKAAMRSRRSRPGKRCR